MNTSLYKKLKQIHIDQITPATLEGRHKLDCLFREHVWDYLLEMLALEANRLKLVEVGIYLERRNGNDKISLVVTDFSKYLERIVNTKSVVLEQLAKLELFLAEIDSGKIQRLSDVSDENLRVLVFLTKADYSSAIPRLRDGACTSQKTVEVLSYILTGIDSFRYWSQHGANTSIFLAQVKGAIKKEYYSVVNNNKYFVETLRKYFEVQEHTTSDIQLLRELVTAEVAVLRKQLKQVEADYNRACNYLLWARKKIREVNYFVKCPYTLEMKSIRSLRGL